MKVYGTPHSPFARKVRVAAIETGQAGAIDWTMIDLNDRPAELGAINPLDQVPVLIRDDGKALYDSPVICEFLDSRHDGPKLLPEAGKARWTVLRLQALGDGLGGASAALAGERRRPEDRQSEPFIANQTKKINAALGALEGEVGALEGPLTIAPIAVSCAMGYMELRNCAPGWRAAQPRLAAWYDNFCQRPSMTETGSA